MPCVIGCRYSDKNGRWQSGLCDGYTKNNNSLKQYLIGKLSVSTVRRLWVSEFR